MKLEQISEEDLSTKQRKSINDEDFALPDQRKYPIHDKSRARNALARVEQYGTPEEKGKVQAAVRKRYPDMEVEESRGRKGKAIAERELSAKQRKFINDEDFALPHQRKYPIHDKSHARNALARVEQYGTPEEKGKVQAAVRKRYPDMEVDED